jgi:predicted nucleotidyltransferase
MIPDDIRAEILRRMHAAEEEHGVRVLLAVESGSRAWGFASPNSDFDARFIYAHPQEWYLSVGLEEQRDVIEYKIVDEIDLNGWDVRKALRLFWRSNPAFVEWVQSPIIYHQSGCFAELVRNLIPEIYSCERGVHHYRSMAKTTFKSHLQGDQVSLKKYFYALRPLLAVRWLERYQTAAPIEFHKLLHLLEDQPKLLVEIDKLLEQKRNSPELGRQAPVLAINAFIEEELARLAMYTPPKPDRSEVLSTLNQVFHQVLAEGAAR